MKIEISDELAREIFERKKLEYTIESIKERMGQYLIAKSEEIIKKTKILDESDYKIMAQYFLNNHDCNTDDNTQYYDAIKYHLEHLWY